MTLTFSRFRAVVKEHVRAKFHQAACSGSWVIVLTERKNSDENNTVLRYRADSNNSSDIINARHYKYDRKNVLALKHRFTYAQRTPTYETWQCIERLTCDCVWANRWRYFTSASRSFCTISYSRCAPTSSLPGISSAARAKSRERCSLLLTACSRSSGTCPLCVHSVYVHLVYVHTVSVHSRVHCVSTLCPLCLFLCISTLCMSALCPLCVHSVSTRCSLCLSLCMSTLCVCPLCVHSRVHCVSTLCPLCVHCVCPLCVCLLLLVEFFFLFAFKVSLKQNCFHLVRYAAVVFTLVLMGTNLVFLCFCGFVFFSQLRVCIP